MTREEIDGVQRGLWALMVLHPHFAVLDKAHSLIEELREPAAPGLTESELDTLRAIRSHMNRNQPFTPGCAFQEELDAIIARRSPPPVVTWTDVGIFSTAMVGDVSLLVQEQSDGRFSVWVRQGRNADSHNYCSHNTRAAAKSAAEKRLAELQRGTK